MSETMTFTFHCAPGTATPERALELAQSVKEIMDAVADGLGGGVTFELGRFQWVDDGVDDVTVTISSTTPTEPPRQEDEGK